MGIICHYDMLQNFEFLGHYFRQMGHFKTFRINIMVTNIKIICRYDMLKFFEFLGQ
jgi:hypothetical protein